MAGWRLGTRPNLLQELDKTAGSELDRRQVYRGVRVDVIHLGAVNDQVLKSRSRRTERRVETRRLCGSHSPHHVWFQLVFQCGGNRVFEPGPLQDADGLLI